MIRPRHARYIMCVIPRAPPLLPPVSLGLRVSSLQAGKQDLTIWRCPRCAHRRVARRSESCLSAASHITGETGTLRASSEDLSCLGLRGMWPGTTFRFLCGCLRSRSRHVHHQHLDHSDRSRTERHPDASACGLGRTIPGKWQSSPRLQHDGGRRESGSERDPAAPAGRGNRWSGRRLPVNLGSGIMTVVIYSLPAFTRFSLLVLHQLLYLIPVGFFKYLIYFKSSCLVCSFYPFILDILLCGILVSPDQRDSGILMHVMHDFYITANK